MDLACEKCLLVDHSSFALDHCHEDYTEATPYDPVVTVETQVWSESPTVEMHDVVHNQLVNVVVVAAVKRVIVVFQVELEMGFRCQEPEKAIAAVMHNSGLENEVCAWWHCEENVVVKSHCYLVTEEED